MKTFFLIIKIVTGKNAFFPSLKYITSTYLLSRIIFNYIFSLSEEKLNYTTSMGPKSIPPQYSNLHTYSDAITDHSQLYNIKTESHKLPFFHY